MLSSWLQIILLIIINLKGYYINSFNSKRWINQRVNQLISNYFTHFRSSHKSINLQAIKNNVNPSKLNLFILILI
jgi:hypothetical protein